MEQPPMPDWQDMTSADTTTTFNSGADMLNNLNNTSEGILDFNNTNEGILDFNNTNEDILNLNNTSEWEDWLRWDPTTDQDSTLDPLSPDSSIKTSNTSPMQDQTHDHFPTCPGDDTLAPPLIVGEDSTMFDFSFDLGQVKPTFNQPSFDFTLPKSAPNTNLQPIVDHLQTVDPPLFPQLPDQQQLSPFTVPGNDQQFNPSMNDQQVYPLNNDQQLNPPIQDQQVYPLNNDQQFNTSIQDQQVYPPNNDQPPNAAQSSPASTDHPRTSLSSPSPGPEPEAPPRKKAGRKRKSSSGDESKDNSGASPEDGPPVKKTSHNVIEKRYRNNLNDKIQALRDSVPSLRAMSRPSGTDESEDLEGLTPAHKLNKATVMAKATEYIKHLEKRNKTQNTEMDALKARLNTLEKNMARSAALQNMQPATSSTLFTPSAARSRQGSVASQPIASAARRIQGEQYAQQHPQPTYDPQPDPPDHGQQRYVNANGGNGLMGKLMVGSLAGLMVMEGFHEHEQNSQGTAARGLFAAPGLVRRGDLFSAGRISSSQTFFPLLKMFLVIGAAVYILAPLLNFKPKPKSKVAQRVRLTAAPSLASPVEVRRKAWLTAVQSVWMPRHFLLEVVSVAVKMLKLSLRRLIGSETYTVISGNNKDDEAARIKAWDIAIDAQLAGGDAEVSYYRLLLTLMVSGTLPDSPIRLMQKAVHFRIFFWELANAGYGNFFMFKGLTAKVGRIYWDSARAQQHALAAGEFTEQQILDDKIEMLPEHLAALIELGCDDVLTDEIIQRAYNLAWNRPSAEKTTPNQIMDMVIEDHAIRSPLDAVAAWFSTTTIDGALCRSLDKDGDAQNDVDYLVDLANKVAPPVSGTQTRALAVKAVLVEEDRQASITATLSALPTRPSLSLVFDADTTTSSSVPANMITHTPVSPDIHIALTLAKVLSLASPTCLPSARVHAASALTTLHMPPCSLTLLTSVAAFKVLHAFSDDTVLFNTGRSGVNDLAASLRMWIGTTSGKKAGLSKEQKSIMVEAALKVSKRVGGWKEEGEEKDSGYGSLQD